MSIPMLFAEDIIGLVELLLRFVVEMLKRFEEKDDLFTIFPIGATMQDGGKRRRSGAYYNHVNKDIQIIGSDAHDHQID